MATTVSAWGKPGAWALDSEAHEEEELVQQDNKEVENGHSHYQVPDDALQPLADFPSLSAAVTTKSKKKKPQVLSLSEFATGKAVTHGSAKSAHSAAAKGLTPDELLILPTGPRERSAEELERSSSRLGGGFRSYGAGDSGRGRYSDGDDSSRWGSSRVSDETRRSGGFNREFNKESAPSRADEIDDWGAAKKSVAAVSAPGYERRERSGGFFDSHSRADESDSWVTKKSFVATEPRRFESGGFENNREKRLGFEGFQKESSDGGEADSDTWLKKKGEGDGSVGLSGSGRPRLVLQPRTLPVNNSEQQLGLSSTTTKIKGSNPFGAARPREEVLAEKGQDWKKLDEQLESVKIKESGSTDGPSQWKKSFGSGNGGASPPENRTERSWRKAEESADAPAPSEETVNEDKIEK